MPDAFECPRIYLVRYSYITILTWMIGGQAIHGCIEYVFNTHVHIDSALDYQDDWCNSYLEFSRLTACGKLLGNLHRSQPTGALGM